MSKTGVPSRSRAKKTKKELFLTLTKVDIIFLRGVHFNSGSTLRSSKESPVTSGESPTAMLDCSSDKNGRNRRSLFASSRRSGRLRGIAFIMKSAAIKPSGFQSLMSSVSI